MKLSIIIVDYKAEGFLPDCLDSISQQEVSFEYEVVIHDNNANNIGFGPGNNRGAERATGEYLFFLNPDTVLIENNSLQKLVTYMDMHDNVGVLGPRLIDKEGVFQTSAGKSHSLLRMVSEKPVSLMYRMWGKNKNVLQLLSLVSSRYQFEKVRTDCDMVSGAALCIRKSLFEKIHGFDEEFFMYFEDDDICLRAKAEGYAVHYYPEVTIKHLVGQSEHNSDAKDTYYYQNQDLFFMKHASWLEQQLIKMFRMPYKSLKLRRRLNRYF